MRAPVDTVLASDAPDLARIPDPELRALVAAHVAGRSLAPAFEVEIARETRLLREDGNEIGFALEAGELRTARGPVPICTLALTTRAGDPGYPAQLALELLEALPLRPAAADGAQATPSRRAANTCWGGGRQGQPDRVRRRNGRLIAAPRPPEPARASGRFLRPNSDTPSDS